MHCFRTMASSETLYHKLRWKSAIFVIDYLVFSCFTRDLEKEFLFLHRTLFAVFIFPVP